MRLLFLLQESVLQMSDILILTYFQSLVRLNVAETKHLVKWEKK